MRVQGPDETIRLDADASLDALIHTLTTHAGRTLGVEAQACATATVRGLDRWLAAASVAAARCDGAQDRHRQGPRYAARETGAPVLLDDLADERRWPVWTHACAVQGFRSAAVVAGTHRDVTVYLSLYGRRPGAWAELAARAAGIAEGIASVVAARDEVIALAQTMDDLLACSRTQPLIDRAVGVVMAQRHCDASEALAYLRAAATDRDAREVAAGLIAGVAPSRGRSAGGVLPQRDGDAPGPAGTTGGRAPSGMASAGAA
ncbi:ANTAR domain-containing protein [Cellulomonas endometrii]|uniref:ANTAR domain-containing protein n=1 Tax=Cellulomonas endometrii TaxID=3036301 RepID=UPI0024AE4137|nr:ANTAR domain-containing protein [Cellulomonas endometrii]